ncbi:MAG: hypothetical protein UX80_C0013G0006 [Candidatus Amesbacteria bacterium GW2011_GWA2_47_11b]|uniref:Asl1-like glycosyl hydrolase catalytic domain-containing protein n=3 Tax=Candidatus Amesiibacteriota TaxID=1752730 RepID=A0A0G1VIG1_9BACT|nr:MAG: hypothetical protein UX42_C0009G0024 [Microgenomates group bacterium GW2011_GWC1_46_20]KKU57558.1 MAG: hypothetical protein UX80_C0013G0006 [Candidatus Amesbacteria bacterium GW2011_GWA2_47_11b]KKU69845.1 MAG: hypothetical protein UX92_C0008G0013 [Candidatus Amesbacteria bacterium GW2011_GWA1_47_20]KKU84648.1 MAG: hypothetical protein UY11_C0005G0022 [Candidatus Amesbacteria bacterium GW2011_GWC2_47_8]
MLKKLLLFLALSASTVLAYDPTSVPNNRIGVHILDPNEIHEAAKLVNSSGGDWGYVTIPIRSNDRDRDKWLKFFQDSRKLHIIPLIRLATFPDGGTWVEPTATDLVDFANFLNDMPWPTRNRYIVLFNEPNHSNEWGGVVNPYAYADILSAARSIFKDRSVDFFLLSAALDTSVPNSPTSMEAQRFYRFIPNWAAAIDGVSVHVYPDSRAGILSYTKEPLGQKPMFMTEVGWVGQPDTYPATLKNIWTEDTIVAITPFLLQAGAGDFAKFSLINSPAYSGLMSLPKIAGSPLLSNLTLAPYSPPPRLGGGYNAGRGISRWIELLNNWFNKQNQLMVGSVTINIEIADTEETRQHGLSGRSSLPANSGKLFVFPQPARHSFWMRDMNFPLDFVWIRSNRVIQLSSSVPATQPPVTLTPDQPVDQVLEVNTGFIEKYGIKVGDAVQRR